VRRRSIRLAEGERQELREQQQRKARIRRRVRWKRSWAGEDWYSSRPWTRLARSRINGHDNESPIPTKPERRIRLIKPIQDGLGALQITIGGEPHNYRLLALAIAFVPI